MPSAKGVSIWSFLLRLPMLRRAHVATARPITEGRIIQYVKILGMTPTDEDATSRWRRVEFTQVGEKEAGQKEEDLFRK